MSKGRRALEKEKGRPPPSPLLPVWKTKQKSSDVCIFYHRPWTSRLFENEQAYEIRCLIETCTRRGLLVSVFGERPLAVVLFWGRS